MTTTSIDTKARFNDDGNPVQAPEIQAGGTEQGTGGRRPKVNFGLRLGGTDSP